MGQIEFLVQHHIFRNKKTIPIAVNRENRFLLFYSFLDDFTVQWFIWPILIEPVQLSKRNMYVQSTKY